MPPHQHLPPGAIRLDLCRGEQTRDHDDRLHPGHARVEAL
jgi:hypothetical protein